MRVSLPFLALLVLTDASGCSRSNARHDAGSANRQSPDARAVTGFDAAGGSHDADMASTASADASPTTGFDAKDGSPDSGPASQPSPDAGFDAKDGSPDSGSASQPSPDAGFDANDGSTDSEPMSGQTPRPVECGDRWMHDTTVHGQANTRRVGLYACTARAESGPETLYAFRSPGACRVSARLDDLHTDLDLFLLRTSDGLCQKASSSPLDLQHGEHLIFDVAADSTHLLLVDGYAGMAGPYTLAVDCLCGAASASFDSGAWRLQVDRRWNGEPTSVGSPESELAESDYHSVSDAAAHDLLVSNFLREVSIGTAPWLGAIAKGTRGTLRYELTTGAFAGGRFVVWSNARGLEAELTLYGSGVPIASSERGRLVRKP
jgi:hypothetical protein